MELHCWTVAASVTKWFPFFYFYFVSTNYCQTYIYIKTRFFGEFPGEMVCSLLLPFHVLHSLNKLYYYI